MDILKQVTNEKGTKYRMEINGSLLNIGEYKKIEVSSDYPYILGDLTKKENISEMRNIVVVTSNNQDSTNKLAEVRDEDSIKRYGMLQEIISVEPSDESKVRNIGKNKLEELNKVVTDASVRVLATDYMRSGRTIKIKNEEFKLDGEYLIKSCTHNLVNNNHIADLEIEVI